MPTLSDRVARIKRLVKAERYFIRIGRNPYCPELPLEKDFHKGKTLKKVRTSEPKRDKLGRYIIHKPF